MIHEKKVSVGAGYANKTAYEYEGKKFEADIKDGDIIKILDEGIKVNKEFKGKITEAVVHKIETRNGQKAFSLNTTSLNNLIDCYGKDSKNWIGKEVKVFLLKAMVSGAMRTIAYLAHPKSEMVEDDAGKLQFTQPEKADMSVEGESEEMNWDDIKEENQ